MRRTPKPTPELLDLAGDVVKVVTRSTGSMPPALTRRWPLEREWLDTCLSAYLLAIFTVAWGSSQAASWLICELGFIIISTCRYDAELFFGLFGITPEQIAYVLFLVRHHTMFPLHLGWELNRPATVAMMGVQEAEGGLPPVLASPLMPAVHALPRVGRLVVDIGMGLGADTRYYLAQGFDVLAVEALDTAIEKATADDWLKPFVESGQLTILHAAVVASGTAGETMTFFGHMRPEQSRFGLDKALPAAPLEGESATELRPSVSRVRSIECADVVRAYGPVSYMKVDVEDQTMACLSSLYHASNHPQAPLRPPPLLSLEVEDTGRVAEMQGMLQALGYTSYKVVRQTVYSPSACESHDATVLGCGSGPFGEAAVDYMRGTRWGNLTTLLSDTMWQSDYGDNRDWFDIHVK